jgi:hypothetical protein
LAVLSRGIRDAGGDRGLCDVGKSGLAPDLLMKDPVHPNQASRLVASMQESSPLMEADQ